MRSEADNREADNREAEIRDVEIREAEIRKQVEDRLKRRGLFLADAGLWLMTFLFLWVMRPEGRFVSAMIFFAFLWTGVLGLHFMRTAYVELRDYLVARAIERERSAERRYYVTAGEPYEKPKRADRAAPPTYEPSTYEPSTRLDLNGDGELVDFDFIDPDLDPDSGDEEAYGHRNSSH